MDSTTREFVYGRVMLDAPTPLLPGMMFCWICRKPVAPEMRPDEFGFFTHSDCLDLSHENAG